MSAVNGTLILLQDDGTAFALSTSCSLNIDVDLPDASSKSSSGWAEHIKGQRSWSVDLDSLADFETTTVGGVKTIIDYVINESDVSIEFEPQTGAFDSAGISFTGTASTSSVSVEASNEDTATLSGSFTGNGALTPTAIS